VAEDIGIPVAVSRVSRVLTHPSDLKEFVADLPPDMAAATAVAEIFRFRVPRFYAANVLNGKANDPLLSVVLPIAEELAEGPELWDATPFAKSASTSPFWVQKYDHQGLIRLTTTCSGICRYCYVKSRTASTRVMTPQDVDLLFDYLEAKGQLLRDVILSGGDPLCAPVTTLRRVAERMSRLRRSRGMSTPFLSIHTREPIWDPIRLLNNPELIRVVGELEPKAIMLHVLHSREVTTGFSDALRQLVTACGDRPPLLYCQHPILRGVNDSVEELAGLYETLLSLATPVAPYYLVYPFYSGTLPRHRQPLLRVVEVYRELCSRPGWFVPRLVVPTPVGKCIVGPNDPITIEDGHYLLKTKGSVPVRLPILSSEV